MHGRPHLFAVADSVTGAFLPDDGSPYRVLFEESPTAQCLCRRDGTLIMANRAFRTLFAPMEDPIGPTLEGLCGLTAQQLCAAGTIELTLSRQAVSRKPVLCRVSELDLQGHQVLLTSWQDLSDQRRTESALVAAERDAVLGRMAGIVAHEVNNPLEAITLYIDPLRRRVADRPEVVHGLTVIEHQVERIAGLVRSLLGLVRQRTITRSDSAITEVLSTIVELFQPRAERKRRNLVLTLPDTPLHGSVDVEALQQILINLLENALTAVPAGGTVTVSPTLSGAGQLRILVEDDGPGLGEHPETLFRPFATSRANGNGLGLAVARRLCEAHGGWLAGDNRPQGGACFTVTLDVSGRSC